MHFSAINILTMVSALATVADATGSKVTISVIEDTSRSVPCNTNTCCQPYCLIRWKDNKYCPQGWTTEVGGTCKSASGIKSSKLTGTGCGGMKYQWANNALVFIAPDAANDFDASAIVKTSCPSPNSCVAPVTKCSISNP